MKNITLKVGPNVEHYMAREGPPGDLFLDHGEADRMRTEIGLPDRDQNKVIAGSGVKEIYWRFGQDRADRFRIGCCLVIVFGESAEAASVEQNERPEIDLKAMTVPQLRALAEEYNVILKGLRRRADIVDKLANELELE